MTKISLWKRFAGSKIIIPLVTLALLLLYNLIFTKNFFVVEIRDGHLYGNLIDILKGAAPIMLISIGLTLVIATKGIDISVGSVVAISAATVAFMIGGDLIMKNGVQVPYTKVPLYIAISMAIGVAIMAGIWNGMLVSRVGMQPIIATLILMVAGRGIAMMITKAQIITVYYEPFSFIGNGYWWGLPFSFFIVLFVLMATLLLVRKTAIGMFIESVGINPTATRFSGINAKNIIFWCYVFTSFCAGIAGVIYCSNVKSADGNNAGLLMELDAILAVVLGGTSLNGGKFYLIGSIIGALIIRTLTTSIWALGVPPELAQVVKAIVIFIVCIIQSEKFRLLVIGMFGRKEMAA
ncbi:MAG TPA: sugar ABC transporter permease [Firmicutes bacterium]|jgi:galactofuranose transport system permease protein|nr:sugar ABC transporter permease [Bacillota bacterium]